jgi:hypothetical protein
LFEVISSIEDILKEAKSKWRQYMDIQL